MSSLNPTPQGDSSFVVMTNYIITEGQKMGKCPEVGGKKNFIQQLHPPPLLPPCFLNFPLTPTHSINSKRKYELFLIPGLLL